VTDDYMKRKLHILKAQPRGFCAGVVRAIATLEAALAKYGPPIYARHAIVHNSVVVASFADRGVVFVEDFTSVPDNAVIVFSAHGVASEVIREAARHRLLQVDATCPLVSKVHSEVRHHVADGRDVLLIGHPNHPEVIGTVGQAPPGKVYVVADREAATTLMLDPSQPYGLAMQTTLSVQDAAEIEAELRRRFPRLLGPAKEDICYATTNRQQVVRAAASRCDAFVVLGSQASSNSRRLAETARQAGCTHVLLLEKPDELLVSWLDGVRVLGLSCGASTPEVILEQLIERLSRAFELSLGSFGEAEETIRFGLPPLPSRSDLELVESAAK
jgi:4-hydroxy-3-methylbut-2-en-1-yl diphosphate reductase